MALTREYRETVAQRIKKDPQFTAALYAQAIEALVEGDKDTTLSILRDLVHAHISFPRLAEQTGMDEKSLHRMLGPNGNPTMENLVHLIHVIEQNLNLGVDVTVHVRKHSSRQVSRQPRLAYA